MSSKRKSLKKRQKSGKKRSIKKSSSDNKKLSGVESILKYLKDRDDECEIDRANREEIQKMEARKRDERILSTLQKIADSFMAHCSKRNLIPLFTVVIQINVETLAIR